MRGKPGGGGFAATPAFFRHSGDVVLLAAKRQPGERLISDPRPSRNIALPCSGCHQRIAGGNDGLLGSVTSSGPRNQVNTPLVFNRPFDFRHTGHSKLRSLEHQAWGGLHRVVRVGHLHLGVIPGVRVPQQRQTSSRRTSFSSSLSAATALVWFCTLRSAAASCSGFIAVDAVDQLLFATLGPLCPLYRDL